MAAPSYTTNLNLLSEAESNVNWVEFTGTTTGGFDYDNQGSPQGADADWPYIQNTYSVTQTCAAAKAGYGSLAYNKGSAIGGHGTDGAYLVWQLFANPNYGTYSAGGLQILIGSAVNSFYAWNVGGSDVGVGIKLGWQNHAVNTTVPPDDNAGAYAGTGEQIVGAAVRCTASIAKGEPHCVDVIRYGRCDAVFEDGDLANGYCNIAGFAAVNDSINNKWGLIEDVDGGYLWKGLMHLGTASTPVDFRDTNVNIFIAWTPKVTENFNTIEIENINSHVEMTGFTFQVLDTSTASRGKFIMTDPADVYLDQCTFIDMYTFVFDSTTGVNTVEITDTTFRRCNEVTQGGATFDGCTFSNSDATSTLQVDNLSLITNCSFQSDGSNHAMELGPEHAGGSYNLVNCTYTGYETSNGSTGNEPIFNNSGGVVTIYAAGGSYPYYRNGPGSTTNIIQAINWYFEIQNQAGSIVNTAEFRIYDSNGNQLYGVETSDGTELYGFDGSLSGTPARIVVHDLNYIHFTQILTHPSTSNTAAAPVVLTLVRDRVYLNQPGP
jgi:hypothetical protein